MTWALGGLRPLEEWGLMKKVDALSSVSGGSWAAAVYMFAPNGTQELLGGPTKPGELTMDVLSRDLPAGIKPVTNRCFSQLVEMKAKGAKLNHLWSWFICEVYLKPFGLCDMWAFMAPDAAAVDRIKKANPDLADAPFQVPRTDRPRAFVINGVLLGPVEYATAPASMISFQMSPDFVGSPFYAGGSGEVVYQAADAAETAEADAEPPIKRLIGGGLVEAFAFGGGSGSGGRGGGEQVTLDAPKWPLSLAQAIGISSMAPGAAMGNIASMVDMPAPRLTYWPITDAKHKDSDSGMATYFGDGASLDQSGLLALLQRGVKRVVWFAACSRLVKPEYNLCDALDGKGLIRAGVDEQILDKFGYGALLDAELLGMERSRNQVFEKGHVRKVVCQLQKHLTDGTPTVLHFTEKVLDNQWWGIKGGWEVAIVLVYLSNSSKFADLLPSDTREEMSKKKDGALKDYPAYLVNPGYGGNEQHNLLAATSEYFVRENEKVFKQLFS